MPKPLDMLHRWSDSRGTEASNPPEQTMTYLEFKAAYSSAFASMTKYRIDEAGSTYYAEKLADLSDAYPEFEVQLEAEGA